MEEIWQVNWRVTYASKYLSWAKNQQEKKSGPVAAFM